EQTGEEEQGDDKGGNEQAGDTQAGVHMSEPLIEKPKATLISSTQTLSSVEFMNQVLNDNPDVTIHYILKDPIEPEVQSMVDVLVTQEKLAELRPRRVVITVTLIHDTTTVSPTQPPQTQPKRRKIKRILKKSKNPESQVDTDLPDFGKIKLEKATKKSIPKYSTTLFDQVALDVYDQKDKLFIMMREFKLFNIHPSYKALYDAFAVSLNVDEDDMDRVIVESPQKKRRQDDQDQDPFADSAKEKKKRKPKDSEPSKKDKTQAGSSKKGESPSNSSK
ncbi:hypothetical protein Tco_1232655, partial [Tanacetum coccineum]